MNTFISAEDYILNFEGQQRQMLQRLHSLLSLDLDLLPKIKYNLPFYYRKSWICYLNHLKNGGVELAFPRGNELSNASGILDARGRKQVMSIAYSQMNQIDETLLLPILQEAIILDETVKYKSKRFQGKQS